ncbi:MAG: protein kinase [Anaerolineales bacterium]|nr:protein kinase [Anaerolineales bacterium]
MSKDQTPREAQQSSDGSTPGATRAYDQPVDQKILALAEASVASDWKVGDLILDTYEVRGVLGEGGMGVVYMVHHMRWDMDLAVKCPKPEVFLTTNGKDNFIRECETWINLGLHPHIVSCYYVRTLGGTPRVFAEYVQAGSLKEWIASHRLYDGGKEKAIKRMIDIAIQIAWGLNYAHEQGVVHQDVKPANVMIASDGTAKVTDFGMAKAQAAAGVVVQTGQSILVSSGGLTPAYCSPEQADHQPLSRETDIWSWGVSVLEMFTSEVTWLSGVIAPEALKDFLKMKAKRDDIPEIPGSIVNLLMQCFQNNPEDRPANAGVITAKLREIYQQETGDVYLRADPAGLELMADSLNNHALSRQDLGDEDGAHQLWQKALEADPLHLESIYNLGLQNWRHGEISDLELLTTLRQTGASGKDNRQLAWMQAQVDLERGDFEAAYQGLIKLPEGEHTHPDIAPLLQRVTDLRPGTEISRSFSMGHTNFVTWVSLSTDGRLALSRSWQYLILWDVSTDQHVRTFEGIENVNSFCMSADGSLILLGRDNNTLVLLEVASGRFLRTFKGHTDIVNSVSLSADGRLALSGSRDNTLKLWDVPSGACLRTFYGHTSAVNSVCLSADGQLAASGSYDRTLKLWEVSSGECLRTFLTGHWDSITYVDLSADGCLAISKGKDGNLKLWDVSSGRCLRTLQIFGPACMSADGCYLLTGNGDKTLKLWEVARGRCLRTWTCTHPEHTVESVYLSKDARFALSGSLEGSLILWKLDPERDSYSAHPVFSRVSLTQDMDESHALFMQKMEDARQALVQNNDRIALSSLKLVREIQEYVRNAEAMELWKALYIRQVKSNFSTGWQASVNYEFLNGWPPNSICLSADGRLALSGFSDNTLNLLDVSSGRCLRTITISGDNFGNTVFLSADGQMILSGGKSDKTLKLWDALTGRCLRTFTGHIDRVNSVYLSADGDLALSGSNDMTLKVWEVSSGKCLRTLQRHSGGVFSVCFSADGRYALSGSGDKTLIMWDVSSGQCLRTLKGHAGVITSVCLSTDGRYALSGSIDKTLKLWDIPSGKCLRTFVGHTQPVTSVCLSLDGRFSISGSYDKTLKLWEVSSGQCLYTFEGHFGKVNTVCLSMDGRLAISGSDDGTMKLWVLDWNLEVHEPADWDERTRPYLTNFLTLHSSLTIKSEGLLGLKKVYVWELPIWDENDFQELLFTLGCAGYGWLRPEGVRHELEKMAGEWQGPPRLPGT